MQNRQYRTRSLPRRKSRSLGRVRFPLISSKFRRMMKVRHRDLNQPRCIPLLFRPRNPLLLQISEGRLVNIEGFVFLQARHGEANIINPTLFLGSRKVEEGPGESLKGGCRAEGREQGTSKAAECGERENNPCKLISSHNAVALIFSSE